MVRETVQRFAAIHRPMMRQEPRAVPSKLEIGIVHGRSSRAGRRVQVYRRTPQYAN
jgi:hypothetical protein